MYYRLKIGLQTALATFVIASVSIAIIIGIGTLLTYIVDNCSVFVALCFILLIMSILTGVFAACFDSKLNNSED